MNLNNSEKIKILCKRQKITLTSVAKELGLSIQNFSNKLAKNNFDENELNRIAQIINCTYESHFILNESNEKI